MGLVWNSQLYKNLFWSASVWQLDISGKKVFCEIRLHAESTRTISEGGTRVETVSTAL